MILLSLTCFLPVHIFVSLLHMQVILISCVYSNFNLSGIPGISSVRLSRSISSSATISPHTIPTFISSLLFFTSFLLKHSATPLPPMPTRPLTVIAVTFLRFFCMRSLAARVHMRPQPVTSLLVSCILMAFASFYFCIISET